MIQDLASLIVPVISVYIAVFAVILTYAMIRRERRRSIEVSTPEAMRWLENAAILEAKGWIAPAFLVAYVGLEQILRAIATQRNVAGRELLLTTLTEKLFQDGILDSEEHEKIRVLAALRNDVVHGGTRQIDDEKASGAYRWCVAIAQQLQLKLLAQSRPKKT